MRRVGSSSVRNSITMDPHLGHASSASLPYVSQCAILFCPRSLIHWVGERLVRRRHPPPRRPTHRGMSRGGSRPVSTPPFSPSRRL
jgi:hypothetical protein